MILLTSQVRSGYCVRNGLSQGPTRRKREEFTEIHKYSMIGGRIAWSAPVVQGPGIKISVKGMAILRSPVD